MGSPIIFPSTGGVIKKMKFNSINLNGIGDILVLSGLPNVPYIIEDLIISNWSAIPSALLTLSLRDTAAGIGNSLVGSITGLNTIATSTNLAVIARPASSILGASRLLTSTNLYLNATVANGSSLTANITLLIKLL